jgi:orotidine-5'-phosphate decarboxylase
MEALSAKERIIVALDVDTLDATLEIVEELKDHVGLFKVGLELIFTILVQLLMPATLREAIDNLRKARRLFGLLRGRLMLDGKFKDIPNTMGGASAAVARLGATSL